MKSSYYPTATDLEHKLNWLAERLPQNDKDRVAEHLGDASELLSYDVCTWWDGCYYCRDEDGNWTQVKCYS